MMVLEWLSSGKGLIHMSILTTLALMATAVVAKVRPAASFVCRECGAESFNPNDIRERYCGRCHVSELEAKLDDLRRDRDDWRRMAEAWRGHMLRESPPAQNAALQQQNLMAQYHQQAAMNAQNFYGQGLGQMLGLAQAQALGDFCNCVPARHDMFLRG